MKANDVLRVSLRWSAHLFRAATSRLNGWRAIRKAVYLESSVADLVTDIGIICLDCNDPMWLESLSVPSGPISYEAAVEWAKRNQGAADVLVKQFMTRDSRCASCGSEHFVNGAFFSRPEQLHRAEQLGISRWRETRQALAVAVSDFRERRTGKTEKMMA